MNPAHSILKGAPVTIRENAQHLAIIESKVSREGVDRAIRQIDSHLFIDAEWDAQFQRLCYAVKFHVAHGAAPLLITDWREPTTRRPLELSSGLIAKVARMNSERGIDALKQAAEENEAMRLYHERESERHYTELTADMVPRMRGTKNTIMPRAKTAAGAAARRQARRDLERKLGLR